MITKCALEFEFCCTKKGSTIARFDNNKLKNEHHDFIWCGQIRRIVRSNENLTEVLSHQARISFIQSGTYVISACVKIIAEGHTCEEIWWAPRAETVTVLKTN